MKLKQLLASTLILGTLSATVWADTSVSDGRFTDISGHWGENYIMKAVERGFFDGKSAELFVPNDSITRAEFIVVMNQLVGVELKEVPEGSPWYQGYFEGAKDWFLLPDAFTLDNVTEPITREEIACMLIKTVGEYMFAPVEGNSEGLTDYDAISDEYADYVSQAVESGLMSGMGEGEFAPLNNATRAEAATVVVSVANKYFPEVVEFDNELCEEFTEILTELRTEEEREFIPAFGSMSNSTWLGAQGLFGFDQSQVEGFSMALSQAMVQAYCVAVVKPVEGQEEAILEGFARFQDVKMRDFANYLIDQYEIACNPFVEVLEDGTIVFVMSENAEELSQAIIAGLSAE